jgi:3-hydroxyacyl-CoA dehydrogenase / enoyl-CoA hydratase / 3-hydroxybutyryl-CoA epimerase
VIATNTSSIPIASIAENAAHLERIVGMHFFSPVHKMPLVEVIQAEKSSSQAVATVVAAARAMGKTVIVVRDGPGFYTSRVLAAMIGEATHIFAEGAPIEEIDSAMTAFGFPIGPLALSDEVGLDVGMHVGETLHRSLPDNFPGVDVVPSMVRDGRLGRKSKLGYYDYRSKKKVPDPGAYAYRSEKTQHFASEFLQRRMYLAFMNEAARCLEEGVLATPRDGDVGAVLGLGFPPFLGGPFRYADTMGIDLMVEQLRKMHHAYGTRFKPAALLEKMAGDNSHFYQDQSR